MNSIQRALLLGTLCFAATWAVPIVTNFPPNGQSGAGYNISDDEYVAVVITTQSTQLRFDSLEAVFNSYCDPQTDCPYTIRGGIYADGGTTPGALLAPFNDESLNDVMEQVVTMTTVSPFVMNAATRYWFVLFGTNQGASSMEWIDGGEIYSDSPYAVADGFSVSVNTGVTWTPVGENDHTQSDGNAQAQINATPIPEPATITMVGFALAFGGLRRLVRR